MLTPLTLSLALVQSQGEIPTLPSLESMRPASAFFVANDGQWDEGAAAVLRGDQQDLVLRERGWSWVLRRAVEAPPASAATHPAGSAFAWLDEEERVTPPQVEWARVDLVPIGAAAVTPRLLDAAPTTVIQYGPGGERLDFETGREALAESIWPGVDLRFRAEADRVKHQFELEAGVDPSVVRIAIEGADARLDEAGRLELVTSLGTIVDAAPIAWQLRGEERVPVEVAYRLHHSEQGTTLSFDVGAIDASLPLVLDPDTIVYCGFIGGSDYEELRGIDVTSNGTVWVAGHTSSLDLTVRGGFQGSYAGGDFDCFVASIDKNGILRHLTYLGGTGRELAYDLSLDPAGNVYIAGGTTSTDFPTAVGPYLTHSGNFDGFLTKLDPTGALVYSGFLGGSQFDSIRGNAVDAAGNHYVIGRSVDTQKPEDPPYTFPTEVGPVLTHSGSSDAFVAMVNAAGDDVVYCGFIGGDGIDYGRDVDVDALGYAYYVGWTNCDETSFPVIGGPDVTYNGGEEFWSGNPQPQYGDGFLARVVPDGSRFAACGYVGGTGSDALFSVRVAPDRSVHIAGHTTSDETQLPVVFGPDLTYNGAPPTEPYGDILVGKLDPGMTSYQYLGYVGGDRLDRAWRMDIDRYGRTYLVGNTLSDRTTFPHQGHGPRVNHANDIDASIAMITANGSRVLYGGFFAGEEREVIRSVAVGDDGYVHVTGWTDSTSFPLVNGPDLIKPGGRDGFVSRFLPFNLLVRAGNAIDPTTLERTDVLFVNGQAGDGERRIMFIPYGGGSVTIDVDALGYDGTPLTEADFVLYVWEGEAGEREISHVLDALGESIGSACFPTPLSEGTSDVPNVHTLVNTTRHKNRLGSPLWAHSQPAPARMTVDIPGPGTYTLQALIEDSTKATGVTISNAIVLVVQ